jgi:hypothetical protein
VCPDPDEGADDVLSFTEPNLAFSLDGQDAGSARIRVHLSAEAAPPWVDEGEDTRGCWGAFCLSLHVGLGEVRDAAECWERELAAFPPR